MVLNLRGGDDGMPGFRGGKNRKIKGGLLVQGGGVADAAEMFSPSMSGGMSTSLGGSMYGGFAGTGATAAVTGGGYTRKLKKRTGKARAHRTKSYSAGGHKKRRGRKTRKMRRRKY